MQEAMEEEEAKGVDSQAREIKTKPRPLLKRRIINSIHTESVENNKLVLLIQLETTVPSISKAHMIMAQIWQLQSVA